MLSKDGWWKPIILGNPCNSNGVDDDSIDVEVDDDDEDELSTAAVAETTSASS